jgi:hypothetical protein
MFSTYRGNGLNVFENVIFNERLVMGNAKASLSNFNLRERAGIPYCQGDHHRNTNFSSEHGNHSLLDIKIPAGIKFRSVVTENVICCKCSRHFKY